MFNNAEIKKLLSGRIGWLESNSPVALSEKSKESRSGRYFQDFHRSVTLQNIFDNMESINAGEDEFEDFLVHLQNSAILNSLNGVFNEDTLIEQTVLFNRDSDRLKSLKSNTGKKVGYKIHLSKDVSHSCILKNISLLFADEGKIKIILDHSSAGNIFEKEVNVEANNETIVDINQPLFYLSDKYKGGYFLLYYESDLRPVEYSDVMFNRTYMFGANSFESKDLIDLSYSCETYGMNIEMCSYRDFTEIIKRNDFVFDNLIGLQMAANVIELILNSTRSNKTERLTKEALNQLYNDLNVAYSSPEFPYTTGIRNQISREIKRIKQNMLPKDTVKTNTPCFT